MQYNFQDMHNYPKDTLKGVPKLAERIHGRILMRGYEKAAKRDAKT